MVEELRKIILTKEEIVGAMDAYRRTVPDFLPHGDIVSCQGGPESTLNVSVKMAYGKNVQNMDFCFKLGDLLGPVIQFCVENNIILPRNSRKCVKMEGERIVLYIVMEAPNLQSPGPTPLAQGPQPPPAKK